MFTKRYKNSNTSAADALHLAVSSSLASHVQISSLCHAYDIDIIEPDVKEGGRAEGDDW